MANGRNILTTAFPDNTTKINNWIKERAGRSQGAAANSAQAVKFYTLGHPAFNEIIGKLKSNVKALKQSRISGKGKDVYRGAYIPQFRFIQRANKMDASTLSHEMAHDWFETNFYRYRDGKMSKDFMKAWGALEKALGVTEKDKVPPRKASEAFARAYEAWITSNEDWHKLINVDDKDKDDRICRIGNFL